MVVVNCDVGWGCGRRTSTDQDRLIRGFQKVVSDFVRAVLIVSSSTAYGVRFCAPRIVVCAMKVAKVGVDDRQVVGAGKFDSVLNFILSGAVQLTAIHHNI